MIIAVLINGEIKFLTGEEHEKYTEDLVNFRLATLEEALDKLTEVNEDKVEDGILVKIADGYAIANDDNGLEMIIII